MTIGLSHGGSTIHTSAKPSNDIHVGTMDGVVTLRRAPNGKWETAHHTLRGPHIHAFVFVDDTVFAGVYKDGVYASTDGGRTWRDIDVPHPDVHRTVIDPRNPQEIRTSGGAGLLLSEDGGGTWTELMGTTNEVGSYPDQLVHLPSDPSTLFISASETGPRSWIREDSRSAGGRIAKSVDEGRSWTVLTGGLPDRLHGNVEAMCIEEAGGTVSLFAGMTDGEVWWSEDGGERWSLIAALAPVSKSVHAEMLTGDRTTDLRVPGGETAAKTVSR